MGPMRNKPEGENSRRSEIISDHSPTKAERGVTPLLEWVHSGSVYFTKLKV